MSSTGVISSIRSALRFKEGHVQHVYDDQWWAYAMGATDFLGGIDDDLLMGDPDHGRAAVRALFPGELKNQAEYDSYLSEQDGRRESWMDRLAELAHIVRFDDTIIRDRAQDASLYTLLSKWAHSALALQLTNEIMAKFSDVDARGLVGAARNVRTGSRDVVGVLFDAKDATSLVKVDRDTWCRLPVDVARRYAGMQRVVELPLYVLYRRKDGDGVLVYNKQYYSASRFVYDEPVMSDVARPTLRHITTTNAQVDKSRDEVEVDLVTFSKFSDTLRQRLLRSSAEQVYDMAVKVVEALDEFNEELMHGNVNLDNVLVREDGSVFFTDFSRARTSKQKNDALFTITDEKNGRVHANAYALDWDRFSFALQLLMGTYLFKGIVDIVKRLRIVSFGTKGDDGSERDDGSDADDSKIILRFETLVFTVTRSKYSLLRLAIENEATAAVEIEYAGNMVRLDAHEFIAHGIQVGQRLGKGAFGVVYEVLDPPGELVLKLARKDNVNEVRMQRRIANHGLCPRVKASFVARVLSIGGANEVEHMPQLWAMSMQRMDTSLRDVLVNAQHAWSLSVKVALVKESFAMIKRLNAAGFNHKDMHAGNIMVSSLPAPDVDIDTDTVGVVKFIDFGLTTYLGSDVQALSTDTEDFADYLGQMVSTLPTWKNEFKVLQEAMFTLLWPMMRQYMRTTLMARFHLNPEGRPRR